jgi:hypothetical protein
MKISYRRTGGFAGMVMSFDIDTETLPVEQAEEIQGLVSAADFFSLPATIPSAAPGADQFQYKLTVESEEGRHTVDLGDAAVPDDLRPLLDKIRVLSRSARNS